MGLFGAKTLKNHYFNNFFIPSIHNTIKASNYNSSIESYVYFSIMVDAMEPGAPYGVNRVISCQNHEKSQFQRYFLSKRTLYHK